MEISTNLYPSERREQIFNLLNRNGRASVAELSQLLKVSEVTVRSDLQMLAAQNLILRTHGGAVVAPRTPELSLVLRRDQMVQEKKRIGAAASEFVVNGDAIFLDASSTALALARNLHNYRDLTILTNSLVVAQAMLEAPGVTVVMTGGILERDTVSLMGADGLATLRKYNIKTGFFGAHGLSFPEGLTDVSAGEAEVKREVVSMCRQVIALIDASKWGRVGPASFANPQGIHIIITDDQAPTGLIKQARSMGTRILLV